MLFRFITPILFFAAAGYVQHHNGQNSGSVIVFPFIDVIYPASKGDPQLMGQASIWVLVAMGVLTLLLQLRREWVYRQHQEES